MHIYIYIYTRVAVITLVVLLALRGNFEYRCRLRWRSKNILLVDDSIQRNSIQFKYLYAESPINSTIPFNELIQFDGSLICRVHQFSTIQLGRRTSLQPRHMIRSTDPSSCATIQFNSTFQLESKQLVTRVAIQ